MHGSLPLARLINGFSQPSPSRIPHLTFHILRRQSPPAHWDSKLCLPNPRCSRHFRRSSSTVLPSSLLGTFKQSFVADERDGLSFAQAEADEVPAANPTHG